MLRFSDYIDSVFFNRKLGLETARRAFIPVRITKRHGTTSLHPPTDCIGADMSAYARIAADLHRMSLAQYITYISFSLFAVLCYQLVECCAAFHTAAAGALSLAGGTILARFKPRSLRVSAFFCVAVTVLAIALGDVANYFQRRLMAEPQRSSKQHFLVLHFGISFTVLTELLYWYCRLRYREIFLYRESFPYYLECLPYPEWVPPDIPFLKTWMYSLDPAAEYSGREPNYPPSSAWRPALCDGALFGFWTFLHWSVNEVIRQRMNPGLERRFGHSIITILTALGVAVIYGHHHVKPVEVGIVSGYIGILILRPVRVGVALFLAWGAEQLEKSKQTR